MQTILETLRQVVGEADFYRRLTESTNYTWDYGAMIEYVVASLLLLTVVSFIFKLVLCLFKRN